LEHNNAAATLLFIRQRVFLDTACASCIVEAKISYCVSIVDSGAAQLLFPRLKSREVW
jgi:hypothetical protein